MTQSKVHKYVGTNEHIYKKVFNIDATYVCTYYTAIKFNIYRRLVHFQFVGASRAVDKDIFLFYVTCEQRTAAWYRDGGKKSVFFRVTHILKRFLLGRAISSNSILDIWICWRTFHGARCDVTKCLVIIWKLSLWQFILIGAAKSETCNKTFHKHIKNENYEYAISLISTFSFIPF